MSGMSHESRELRAFTPALILLAICALINYVDRGNLSIAAPLLKDELGISVTQVGMLLSAFFWTYTAMQFVSGWIVDSFDANRVIAAGFLLWSLTTAATGLVRGFTMLLAMRNPPTGPQSRGVDAVNISLAHGTEFSRFTTFFLSSTFPPNGFNWANWSNPEFDALVDKIEKSSDPEEIAANIRKAHEVIVDDAAWLFIVHDLNPRAMTKHIKGFVSAQSWFQDFTPIYME